MARPMAIKVTVKKSMKILSSKFYRTQIYADNRRKKSFIYVMAT